MLDVTGKLDRLIRWQHAARLVEETASPVALLAVEDGSHGWVKVAPFHRYKARRLGSRTAARACHRQEARSPGVSGAATPGT